MIPMIVRDFNAGGFVRVNRPFFEKMGATADDLAQQPLIDFIHPDDRSLLQKILDIGEGSATARHKTTFDGWVAYDWRMREWSGGSYVLGNPQGSFSGRTSQDENSMETARLSSMSENLEAMLTVIEDNNPGIRCSVLFLTADGMRVSVGAGPSLPVDYNNAVEGLVIGPTVGSCGTAAFWNIPVIVEDIQTDPLWKDLKDIARSAGLGACWSHPFTSTNGRILGALAFYSPVPSQPTAVHMSQLEISARMVGLAVERGLAEAALRESEAAAKVQTRLLGAVTEIVTFFVDTGDWPAAGKRLVAAARELTSSKFGFLGVVRDKQIKVTFSEGRQWNRPDLTKEPGNVSVPGQHDDPFFTALFQQIVETGNPVISNDPSEDVCWLNQFPSGYSRISNFLGVPIIHRGEVVALIGVGDRSNGYAPEDLRIAQALSRSASVLFDSHDRQEREEALEDQLRQAGKMEALGVLAGGIAHDFNNMLAVVLGNAELAIANMSQDSPTNQYLREIVTASSHATELCNQMLAYAGRGVLSMERVNCNQLIRELGTLLQVALPKKASLEYQLISEYLFVQADKTQLRQVVLNLLTNAAESIDSDVGRIVIRTTVRQYSKGELELFRPNASLEPGEYVCLSVQDTGSGMSAETQARMFDPFFTTKFTGRGLGLAAVRGIVMSHKGAVGLESSPGKGTVFTVLLPRAETPEGTISGDPSCSGDHSGKRILVVDDEPDVLKVVGTILEQSGFDVLCASDGQEAIEVFQEDPHAIDCVLLDLSMPKLDGEETFRELQRIRQDVRVVLISGYSEKEMLDRFEGAGIAGVLQKPAPRKTLIAKLQEALVS